MHSSWESFKLLTGQKFRSAPPGTPEAPAEHRPPATSPLQLAVYWRLSLIFFFTALLFFLDIFCAAIARANCRRGNGTRGVVEALNQSAAGADSEGEGDGALQSGDSVCGWMSWLPYGQTFYMVGLLLGSLVGGALSDRYGKRPVLLVCTSVHAVCGILPAVLPQPHFFLAVRCLTGVCCCCINICSFSLVAEWTRPSARVWPPAFLMLCFSLGTMAGAPLAWLSITWKQLHLMLALPQLVCLPLLLSVPESPCWLMLFRRTDVLNRYRLNSPADKQCLDLLLEETWPELLKATEAQKEKAPGGHGPCDVIYLRHPTVLLRLLIMSYLSAASALTYFGICMNIGSFGIDVFSAQFFSGLSEVPCLLLPLLCLGRRPLSMLALFLSGAACFLSLLLSKYHGDPILVMSLALLGKLCILAAIFILTLYNIELFPTVVRQRCVSLVNLCFRLGCLFNTLVPANPNGSVSFSAMLMYSCGPIVGCGLCLLLPETSGVPLPDTVEDCDQQKKLHPPSVLTLCGRS